uniref:Putative plant transposon protein domain-containing protein n=1 Tax=Cucumis melo TaxID=3656 RepID=A0A9I9E1S3_CUCME
MKKNKKKEKEKPITEFGEEDWNNLSPLEEEVEDRQPRKKKKALEGQDAMRRVKKEKTQQEEESQEIEDDVLSAEERKHFMVEKGFFMFEVQLQLFLVTPIKALGWQEFLRGVIAIRSGVVKMFYNGKIDTEKHYAIVKERREPSDCDMQEALERVAWARKKWDVTSIKKYRLFLHNLTTEASVWLVFIKKKLMPTRHDNTISFERIMLLYCIMEEIPVDVDEIICDHIKAWVQHPRGAKPFPHLIERLCLRSCSELEQSPQIACVQDGMCNTKST